MTKKLTTQQAAEALGVSPARVRHMILKGQLPAEKFGRDLMILETDLSLVADRRAGRPKKPEAESTKQAKSK